MHVEKQLKKNQAIKVISHCTYSRAAAAAAGVEGGGEGAKGGAGGCCGFSFWICLFFCHSHGPLTFIWPNLHFNAPKWGQTKKTLQHATNDEKVSQMFVVLLS